MISQSSLIKVMADQSKFYLPFSLDLMNFSFKISAKGIFVPDLKARSRTKLISLCPNSN